MRKNRISLPATITGLAILWPAAAFAQDEVPAPEPVAEEAEPEVEAPPPEPAAEPEPEPEPAEEEPTETQETVAEEPPAVPAAEGPKPYIDPQFNFGTGLRVGYSFDFDAPGNFAHVVGTNIRPYLMGQVSRHIKFEANLDSNIALVAGEPVATIRPLDAVIKLEFDDLVNFWVGRFLPPSDRANLSGPYFQNSWNYPVYANLFPAIYAGRHDGAAYWGMIGEGMLKWQVGIFDATYDDNPLLAGRVVLNLLDPEPGYYNSSTYYGTKEILAIAGTMQYQDGGDTVTGTGIDGVAAEIDVLFEKPLGEAASSGTLTLEGAYYNFNDTDQGQSLNVLASYLLPGKQGVGALQPAVRMQLAIPQAGDTFPAIDGSLNYIIDGHNARFTLNYQHVATHDGIEADNVITLGGQLQVF